MKFERWEVPGRQEDGTPAIRSLEKVLDADLMCLRSSAKELAVQFQISRSMRCSDKYLVSNAFPRSFLVFFRNKAGFRPQPIA